MPTRREAVHPIIDGDEYVPALLSLVNNKLSSSASDLYLRHFGVGINEWRVLSVLSNTPQSATAHICETVGMHKTVASRSLRDLEVKGLLTVERRDGQRMMVLTARGQQIHDQVAAAALERESLLMSVFTAQEQAQLREFLRRMRSMVDVVNAWEPGSAGNPLPRGPE